jgi:hypothetical protein
MMPRSRLLTVIVVLLGCEGDGSLFIDVRTDLLPGVEFDSVHTTGFADPIVIEAMAGDPFLDGVRAAELEGLEHGPLALRVELYRGSAPVLGRGLRVQVDGSEAATVVLTRDCRGVACDEESDPALSACFGGRCVSESCFEEASGECGMPTCRTDADCPSSDCSAGRCLGGACLLATDLAACGLGRGCAPERGCPSGAWIEVDGGSRLGPLKGAMAAYHEMRQTVLIYGGAHLETSAALWEWDGTSLSVVCDPCAPGPRFFGGLAYDEARDRLLLFGGASSSTTTVDELWEWDGATWSRIDAPGAPSPRVGFAFVHDPERSVTVVIGGTEEVEGSTLDDPFVYEYDGSAWQARMPLTAGVVPVAHVASTFVPSTGIVIYGGQRENMFVTHDGMWAWNGSEFLELCNECTGLPRKAARMAHISSRDTLLLFNGFNMGEIPGTWDYDPAASRFSQSDIVYPPARDSQAVAYDRRRDVLVTYGGNGDSCEGNCDELYEYRPD